MSDNKERDTLLKELGIESKSNEFEGLSSKELAAEQQRLDVELKKLELADRLETMAAKKRKNDVRRQELLAKNKSLQDEMARNNARQRGCSHRKGGTTVAGTRDPLPTQGGDSDRYALIKFQLPNGDWWVQCQRCAAEWLPEDAITGRPETVIGGISHSQVLMFPTDNTAGGASQFVIEDHRTPEQKEMDRWKPPVDENGKEVVDVRALPPGVGLDGTKTKLRPPAPVASAHR